MRLLRRLLVLLLLAVLMLGLTSPAQQITAKQIRPFHVVLLTPRNDAFWTLAANMTQAAAHDLGIELEWLPALNDPQKHLADALSVLNRVNKPLKLSGPSMTRCQWEQLRRLISSRLKVC